MDLIKLLFIVFVLLQAADAVTTTIVLDKGGREANPVMKWLFDKFEVIPTFIITKGVVIALFWHYSADIPVWLWLVMIGFYGWVVYNNLGVIEKLQKKPE
jgi:hypothetical protein